MHRIWTCVSGRLRLPLRRLSLLRPPLLRPPLLGLPLLGLPLLGLPGLRLAGVSLVLVLTVAACGDGDGSDPRDGFDCGTGPRFVITLGADVRSEGLGALQFDVVALGAGGCFVDGPNGSPCELLDPGPLFQSNYRGLGVVSTAAISLSPFVLEGDFARCYFRTTNPVAAGRFAVNVIEAASVTSEALPNPAMSVVRVEEVIE